MVAVALALVLGLGGALVSQRSTRQLVDAARDQASLAVQAFSQAASAWIGTGSEQTLQRIGELMITGSSHFVQVVADSEMVLDLARAGFEAREPIDQAGGLRADQAQLLVGGGDWIIEAIAPMPTAAPGTGDSYVRAGIDAQFLAARILSTNLRIIGVGAVLWLTALGAHWLVRRSSTGETAENVSEDQKLIRGGLVIDTASYEVSLHGECFRLTPNQLGLLQLLANVEGRVFAEKEILETVWPTSRYADSNNIRQCIHTLRARLRKVHAGAEECIVTVKGYGYSFDSSKLPEPMVRQGEQDSVGQEGRQ